LINSFSKKYSRRLSLFLIFIWGMFIVTSSPGFVTFAHSTTVKSITYKKIIPTKTSKKIFVNTDRFLTKIAEKISKQKNTQIDIYMRLIDKKNRIFFAFKGFHEIYWPFSKETDHRYKIETNGDVIIDLYAWKTKTIGKRAVFEFRGDIIINLDKLVVKLAKFVTQVAASYALDFVCGKLVDFLANANTDVCAEAFFSGAVNFSSVTAGKVSEETLKNVVQYQTSNPVLKTILKNIKNGNILSFFTVCILNVGIKSGMSIVGSSIGAIVGTMICPGAGTIIGSLVAKAGTMIIVNFIVKKIAVDFYFKNQLGKMLKIAKNGISPNSVNHAKYSDYHNKVLTKLKDSILRDNFEKFDILVKFLKTKTKREITCLRKLIINVKDIIRKMVLQDDDWNASRKYYQLKQVLIEKKITS